jgi:hypothetical protein
MSMQYIEIPRYEAQPSWVPSEPINRAIAASIRYNRLFRDRNVSIKIVTEAAHDEERAVRAAGFGSVHAWEKSPYYAQHVMRVKATQHARTR